MRPKTSPWPNGDSNGVLRCKNKSFRSNSYICCSSQAPECVLIDPGMDGEGIEAVLHSYQLEPKAIFCTHGHFDHLGSADFFQTKYHIPLYLHSGDVRIARSSNLFLGRTEIRITVPTIDFPIEDGFRIAVGEDPLSFTGAPGHTPGSCLLRIRNAVFSGDTIYRNAIGHSESPAENKQQLRDSILRVWNEIPDDCWIYPGHGETGLFGEIKRDNMALREFLSLPAPSLARP